MQKLYAASLQACHTEYKPREVSSAHALIEATEVSQLNAHTSIAILATSKEGAKKRAMQHAKEIFPEEEWNNHTVSVMEIPGPVVVEAARAILPKL